MPRPIRGATAGVDADKADAQADAKLLTPDRFNRLVAEHRGPVASQATHLELTQYLRHLVYARLEGLDPDSTAVFLGHAYEAFFDAIGDLIYARTENPYQFIVNAINRPMRSMSVPQDATREDFLLIDVPRQTNYNRRKNGEPEIARLKRWNTWDIAGELAEDKSEQNEQNMRVRKYKCIMSAARTPTQRAVALLVEDGYNQIDIGELLGLSRHQVGRIIKTLRAHSMIAFQRSS